MAPYDLSDFAVKETKIPQSHLIPPKMKSSLGRFLLAHLIDFWTIFCFSIFTKMMFKLAVSSLILTENLQTAWADVDFTPMTFLSMIPMGFAYFFSSYFMNHGQTYGMKLMKCRVNVEEHGFRDSFSWTLKSFGVLASLGLVSKRFSASVLPHDHLWQALVSQKEMAAPDVRTLTKEVKEKEFAKAA